jgi:hypothetical protein
MVVMVRLAGILIAIDMANMVESSMIAIVIPEIQADIAKQHVLMICVAYEQVLDFAYRAGNGSLCKNNHKGNA